MKLTFFEYAVVYSSLRKKRKKRRGKKKSNKSPDCVPDSAHEEQCQNFLFRSIKPKLMKLHFEFSRKIQCGKENDNQQLQNADK